MQQTDKITRPYAHAGLAPGKAQRGTPSNKKLDIQLVFKAFPEHVENAQKNITCVTFGGLQSVKADKSSQTLTVGSTLGAHT